MSEIYTAIPKIMDDLGAVGKNSRNAAQGYNFRGIDDIVVALKPLLARYGVFYVPYVIGYTREEKPAKSGGVLMTSILEVEFTFYAIDGSSVKAKTVGEAMDSGDKSINKAMSAALKYALIDVFNIPTTEPKDSEHESPEPAYKPSPARRKEPIHVDQKPVVNKETGEVTDLGDTFKISIPTLPAPEIIQVDPAYEAEAIVTADQLARWLEIATKRGTSKGAAKMILFSNFRHLTDDNLKTELKHHMLNKAMDVIEGIKL